MRGLGEGEPELWKKHLRISKIRPMAELRVPRPTQPNVLLWATKPPYTSHDTLRFARALPEQIRVLILRREDFANSCSDPKTRRFLRLVDAVVACVRQLLSLRPFCVCVCSTAQLVSWHIFPTSLPIVLQTLRASGLRLQTWSAYA